MKKILTVLSLCVLVVFPLAAQQTNVLFLGNSYTAQNQLPNKFKELALSAGDTVHVDSNTPGGYTLGVPGNAHLYNTNSLDLINEGIWDFVVLQDQSQMPTIPYYRDNYTFPAADSLNTIILHANGCAKTVFYMTWGRKYGGQQCINSYCSPVFTDYFHMQDSLESAYMHMAVSNDAYCAPVGKSWSNSIANGDPIELFASDASHPSLAGTYLAACTFYATIFNKSPVGIEYTAGLSFADAEYLQQVAAYTVLGDPGQWNIFPPELYATSFTYEINGTFGHFTNTTTPDASVYLWDFGDPASGNTNTSSMENPNHIFSGAGNFTVTLLAGDSCRHDIFQDSLTVITIGITEEEEDMIHIYPNPATDVLNIKLGGKSGAIRYVISGLNGRKLLEGLLSSESGKTQIKGLSEFASGIYLLSLSWDTYQINRKIILSSN